jgi:hypothetical protein
MRPSLTCLNEPLKGDTGQESRSPGQYLIVFLYDY